MICKMCNSSNLEKFLDLGDVPLVDHFLTKDELTEDEKSYPLNLNLCKDCGLVQLGHIVPMKELYNESYAYESSITKTRRENHFELAKSVCLRYNIPKDSLVVDIGSNVGVLLEGFKSQGMQVLGIDASPNVVKIANSRGMRTIEGFFDEDLVKNIVSKFPKPHIVTATNLFAHIQNYHQFIKSLKKLLREDGIFVFQVPHFLQLLKNLEYDTIYHEHISYFGLKPLIQFFKQYDLEIFDIIETDIDGGSIRCFVGKKGLLAISSNIKKILNKENESGIYEIEILKKFAKDVKNQKNELIKLLTSIKNENKRIVGVSAPAKGMMLLNYCKIGNNFLDYVTEKSSLKIGKFTPGTHIPVKPDKQLLEDKPDYALILAWNFAEEIIKNLEEYKKNKGQFIIPIPKPRVL